MFRDNLQIIMYSSIFFFQSSYTLILLDIIITITINKMTENPLFYSNKLSMQCK